MVALVAVANPLFSASGSTLVAQLGPMAIYQESIAYGACAGALLVAVVLWFEDAACVLTQDRLAPAGCPRASHGDARDLDGGAAGSAAPGPRRRPCARRRSPPRPPRRKARATAACAWRTSS
jgi:hypothetical protein